jgi:hypothetical protein
MSSLFVFLRFSIWCTGLPIFNYKNLTVLLFLFHFYLFSIGCSYIFCILSLWIDVD